MHSTSSREGLTRGKQAEYTTYTSSATKKKCIVADNNAAGSSYTDVPDGSYALYPLLSPSPTNQFRDGVCARCTPIVAGIHARYSVVARQLLEEIINTKRERKQNAFKEGSSCHDRGMPAAAGCAESWKLHKAQDQDSDICTECNRDLCSKLLNLLELIEEDVKEIPTGSTEALHDVSSSRHAAPPTLKSTELQRLWDLKEGTPSSSSSSSLHESSHCSSIEIKNGFCNNQVVFETRDENARQSKRKNTSAAVTTSGRCSRTERPPEQDWHPTPFVLQKAHPAVSTQLIRLDDRMSAMEVQLDFIHNFLQLELHHF